MSASKSVVHPVCAVSFTFWKDPNSNDDSFSAVLRKSARLEIHYECDVCTRIQVSQVTTPLEDDLRMED